MEMLFWLSIAFIAYVYAGYPALLGAWSAIKGQRAKGQGWATGTRHKAEGSDSLPGVSLILAARDEAARLPGRLDNLLALDYPRERMQIIVASDGSTDDTVEALAPYREQITLLTLPPSGKAGA